MVLQRKKRIGCINTKENYGRTAVQKTHGLQSELYAFKTT